MKLKSLWLLLACSLIIVACDDDETTESGNEAGTMAGAEAGTMAGTMAGTAAGTAAVFHVTFIW